MFLSDYGEQYNVQRVHLMLCIVFTELGHTYSSVFTQFGSLRASSPGRSGGEAGKGRSQSARRACLQAIRVSGGSFHCSNSDEFCDTAPLSKPFGMFETMRSLRYNKLAV